MSALGVDVLSTLWADNASSVRHSAIAPLLFIFWNRSELKIPPFLKFVLSKQLCLVAARLSECCSVFYSPLIIIVGIADGYGSFGKFCFQEDSFV